MPRIHAKQREPEPFASGALSPDFFWALSRFWKKVSTRHTSPSDSNIVTAFEGLTTSKLVGSLEGINYDTFSLPPF